MEIQLPAGRNNRTVQTASKDVSVRARLRRIATFLFIGALEAYLLTYMPYGYYGSRLDILNYHKQRTAA